MANTDVDRSLLLSRLPGLDAAREKVEEEILNIRRILWPEPRSNARGSRRSADVKGGGATKKGMAKKGRLSDAGRKRLSELMKARWAARRGATAKKATKVAARKRTA